MHVLKSSWDRFYIYYLNNIRMGIHFAKIYGKRIKCSKMHQNLYTLKYFKNYKKGKEER